MAALWGMSSREPRIGKRDVRNCWVAWTRDGRELAVEYAWQVEPTGLASKMEMR